MESVNPVVAGGSLKVFPKELKSGVLRRLDRGFATIFAVTISIVFLTVFLLSQVPVSKKATQKQVAEIQRRYARLVLDIKEKEVPVKKELEKRVRKEDTKKVEKKIDRKKESVAEKIERKQKTREERTQRREKISKQIASTGIFAAITASSGDGSGVGDVEDLIGTGDVTSSLEQISMSGQTFAQRSVDKELVRKRRESRARAGSIAKSKLGSAKSEGVERRGNVAFSSKPQEIKGDAQEAKGRTYEAIGKVIKRQQARLVYVFEKFLKKNPDLSGKLVIKFTILSSGKVTNVSVVSSTIGNSEFESTITRYVKRWRFKAISGGAGDVTVTYPFVFTGSR